MKLYLTICAVFLVYLGHAQLSGAYTIGGTTANYGTINAAINALVAEGVSGPVTFNIRPGIYVEHLSFNANDISGLSWTNTVTFQPETRDSATVQISYSSDDDWFEGGWIMQVEYAHHLIFRFIQFKRTGSYDSDSANRLVGFFHANHVEFDHCSFEGSADTPALCALGIYISGNASHIKVDHCSFNALKYCFQSQGDPADTGIVICNSVFSNFRRDAINIVYLKDSLLIENNYFTNDTVELPNEQIEDTRAIAITNCQGVVELMKNRVEGRYGSTALYVSCMNGTPEYLVKIYNNFISVGNGSFYPSYSGTTAFDFANDAYIDFQYNSINLYGTLFETTNRYCRTAVSLAYACSNIRFVNNIIQSDSLGSYFGIGSDNVYADMFSCFDHNNYYNTNGYDIPLTYASLFPVYWNTNATSFNPMYLSRDDLHALNPELGVAIPTSVTDDIDGEPRTHPTLGADEGSFAGVPEIQKNEYLIYPNPTNGVLHVLTNSSELIPYTITDINGKLIQNGQVSSSSNIIVLNDIESGVYCIRFSNSGSATRFVR